MPHCSFNTQPPEGGWTLSIKRLYYTHRFNTQPPEGGWAVCLLKLAVQLLFQHTAARRRLDR